MGSITHVVVPFFHISWRCCLTSGNCAWRGWSKDSPKLSSGLNRGLWTTVWTPQLHQAHISCCFFLNSPVFVCVCVHVSMQSVYYEHNRPVSHSSDKQLGYSGKMSNIHLCMCETVLIFSIFRHLTSPRFRELCIILACSSFLKMKIWACLNDELVKNICNLLNCKESYEQQPQFVHFCSDQPMFSSRMQSNTLCTLKTQRKNIWTLKMPFWWWMCTPASFFFQTNWAM